MAFEEVTTESFKTYLTKYGMKKLLNNDLKIKFFSLNDKGVNYGETVDSTVLVKSVTGDELKTLYNSGSNLKLITDNVESVDTTTTVDVSKREIVFIDDCNNTEYKNINAVVYLGNYLKKLQETADDIEGVAAGYESFVRLFDTVKVYDYVEDAFGVSKLWNTSNDNITYTFESEEDYNKYKIFDNTHMVKTESTTTIKYDENRFQTPFKFTVSSLRSENGVISQNGPGYIKLYPVSTFGYLADGTMFNPEDLTQRIYDSSKNIIPVVKFNNVTHKLKVNDSVVYKSSVNREIFRYTSLLDSGVTAAKNMFEFYGTESADDPNVRVITINMKVNTNSTDTVKAKDAILKLTLILDLDDTNWVSTNDIININ